MMALVVCEKQDLGVEVEHIPGGALPFVNLLTSESTNHARTGFAISGRIG
jgi:hypothetical protein